MTKLKTSQKFSMKGWNFGEWVSGNGEALKIGIGAAVTIAAMYPETAPLVAAGGIGAIVIKMLLDIVDYYISEVNLE